MSQVSSQSASVWAGRIIGVLAILALLADAASILMLPPGMQAKFAATGFSDSTATALGAILLICTIFYAMPRTAVLGKH
jgi:hypothetical protein